MKLKFYETYDYRSKKIYWWSMRDINGRCAEIRQNDNGGLMLYICDEYTSTHDTLSEAMAEAEKHVGEHNFAQIKAALVKLHEHDSKRSAKR